MLCQISRGPVIFLVGGGGCCPQEELLRQSGICQGDPLSPIFFSLITSLIVFVLRQHGLEIWLYSDDALLCLACPWEELDARLHAVLHDFLEFGDFTGLRLNLGKTKALV